MRLSLASSLQLHIFSRNTSSHCISMVTLQFSLYLHFLGYLSLLILKHILVIGAVEQYFHSSNTSQSHETFLDTQVLPVSVSLSSLHFCTLLT